MMKLKPINPNWWKEAVVYQIYPRSFQDSNNDGIGDLKGIVSRLDYIKKLGTTIIWLNPICASPNDDNGYDISDYRAIMNDFGTMEDFDFLLNEIHIRDMKLILDLVVNHTSDEHPWFAEARKSRTNPYYHYYHWWPKEKGEPPLRPSYFDEDGSAWRYNPDTRSYYLHYFSRKQPDLNWENPTVRREIYDMMTFWLDKGIDGFRMDSIPLISKDTSFPELDPAEWPDIFVYYAHGPHLHDYLQEMYREVLSKYNIMTVGEGSALTAEDILTFVDPERQELDMLYGFGPSGVRGHTRPDASSTGLDYSLIALKQMFSEWDMGVGNGWPAIYLGNHDQPRMISRFGNDSPEFRETSAKMLATFLLTMRGTPYWYAGDEIGMVNIKFNRIEDYNDISTRNHYLRIEKEKGDTQAFLKEQKQTARDNARTPFQWDDTPQAGFTTGIPWLKINPDYKKVNAALQEKDPESVLNYFRRLITFRKANRDLIYGEYTLLEPANKNIFAYLREGESKKFLIVLNFTSKNAKFDIRDFKANFRVTLNNYPGKIKYDSNGRLKLQPFQAILWESDQQYNIPDPT